MTVMVGTDAGARTLDGDVLIEGVPIHHLATHSAGWWAIDAAGSVYHDGTKVAAMPDGATGHCVQPTDQTTWIGADRARLFEVSDGLLIEDEFFADAPGRDDWFTPWGDPADVRSMTVDADHTLYVNVHVGGVLRYDSTGVVPTIDIESDVHQVAAHENRKGMVFAACAYGLAGTGNGHDFEIRSDGLHARYCRAVAVMEDRVIVSASTGPSTNRGRLYRGDLADGAFEPLTDGLPEWFDGNLNTHCLLARDGSLFAGYGDTVWVSDDGGDTWAVAAAGLDRVMCLG